MQDQASLERNSRLSLERLIPRLEARFVDEIDSEAWQGLLRRIKSHFPQLFSRLYGLYGDSYDFFYHLEEILSTGLRAWQERPSELRALDAVREANPLWFQSNRMVGAMCYPDLFAGQLNGVRDQIPYLAELGVTYLHLMPMFKTPEGDNDGGYAVSSYRELESRFGTMSDLATLAAELRHHGISLVLDFVFNHTSDEHEWAKRALSGDEEYQSYYRMFPDREMPDAYERTINPIFPDEHPGCFTYRSRIRKWVWTTFHNYQWDLNYENPVVFNRMAEEMLFLANQGVEVLRLDAVAFTWKRIGTSSDNLPEAHVLIQAFNALVSIVAPAVVFKSEAIVHPDEVAKYIREDECPLSYNPQLMALLWEALATRDIRLIRYAMQKRLSIPESCAWVNYVRCHDDIGWTFSDDDAREVGLDPKGHRKFLSEFYIGRFKGSFARGLAFQENPVTGDVRVSGTTASLCGLEAALEAGDEALVELAVRRMLLLHAVICTIGGIPLIYLGDEIGLLNDYDYTKVPEKDGDTRWVHRPVFDMGRASQRRDLESIPGRIHSEISRLIQMRKRNPAFSGADVEIVDFGNDSVFAYFRNHEEQSVLVLANFSETPQALEAQRLRLLGWDKLSTDIVSGRTIVATRELLLEPYQYMVLVGLS